MNYIFKSPTEIKLCNNVMFYDEMVELVKNKSVIFFIEDFLINKLELDEQIQALKGEGNLFMVTNIPPNPTDLDVFNTLKGIRCQNADLIIAVGGGSTIDLAKACSGLWHLKAASNYTLDTITDIIAGNDITNEDIKIPIIAVPTTAGTGSEVTKWATVWDYNGKLKYSIDDKSLQPKQAIIIPEFTMTLPMGLTISTGLDALSHAVEAYWAKTNNDMVREVSKLAISLIVKNLPLLIGCQGQNLDLRKKMCLGSVFAGIAFSNTRTTACHSISYPLTMQYNIPHGFACAMTLAQVMEINRDKIVEYGELLSSLQVTSTEEFQAWLDSVVEPVTKLRLDHYGVKDIESLVTSAFNKGRMGNNPVDLSVEDVRSILNRIYT